MFFQIHNRPSFRPILFYLMITKNRLNGKLLTGDNAIKLYYSEKSKRILANAYEQKQYSCFRKSAEDVANDLVLDLDF